MIKLIFESENMLTQAEYDNTIRRLQNFWKNWISKQLTTPLTDLTQTISQIVSIRDNLLQNPHKYSHIEPVIYSRAMEEFALLGVYPEQKDFPQRFKYFNQWLFGEILVYFAESLLYESVIIQALNAYEQGVQRFDHKYQVLENPDLSQEYPEYFVEFLALCDKRKYLMPNENFFAQLLTERKKAIIDWT